MQKATQDENSIRIDTPLGKDALYLTRFVLDEGISRLFSLAATVYTNGQEIAAKDLIGKEVCITLELGNNTQRYIHGVVAELNALGLRVNKETGANNFRDYHLTIVPAAWYMQHKVNSRIFKAQNVLKIVETLASEHGIKLDASAKISGSYPDYEYKVQYEEADFSFISRLLEQEGIFYFFEHSKGQHKLILADKAAAYEPCLEKNVKFHTGTLAEAHISQWQKALRMVPGKFVQRGYNLEKPKSLPTGTYGKGSLVSKHADYEIFNYAAEAETHSRSKAIATIRLEALQRDMAMQQGASSCRSFTAGRTFTISEHEDKAEVGKQYVITDLRLDAAIINQAGANQSAEKVITNSFRCVPKDVAYRPLLQTAKPLVKGVQTATVTCKGGEEISVDELGRVTVKFHWDRSDVTDHESSCPIRVSQNWAGKKWGMFFYPRRDQEVLVEFLNGDPDQPVIIGAVYNSDHMPPYDLPVDKTQSGVKSRSSEGGGADNFNEIRFEDKKGDELLYLHAEKDFKLRVENDQQINIDNDSTRLIKGNDTDTVNKDRNTKVDGAETHKIGKSLTIEAGDAITIKTGAASIAMKSDGSIAIKGVNITINGAKVSIN
ncbi:type VI secretion system secreted protein VgrG [Arsukibacterium tuosuense]|uniref:Type VI secretion system secreted protein VgrG n=1 Tax=Arsukibacterium tuosuense TaxID=1323745 RepID=A0A285I4Y5_9GAMM|nr:type VI secretion system tip protein TssI/VgrG [Arsukibacterium tuosuense]SNY42963.1 type VI secretion system secreted protein VgrG [Arsukibacterium tuosuense]